MPLPNAATELVRSERRGLVRLRNAAKAATYGVTTASAALSARHSVEMAITGALLDSTADAKRAAHTALSKDVHRVAKELETPIETPNAPPLNGTDRAHATLAASSFATSWAAAALAGVFQIQDSRLRRIATTETARGFARSFAEMESDIEAKYRGTPFLGKRWRSDLDVYTCVLCLKMNGKITKLGRPWPGNLQPGYVHIGCRCVHEFTLILKA